MQKFIWKLRIFLTAVGLIGLSSPSCALAFEIKVAVASAVELHTDVSASPSGEMFYRGVELGLRQLQPKLSKMGVRLVWKRVSASQDPLLLKKLAQDLNQDGTDVLIGPVYSSDLLVMAREFKEHSNPPLVINAAATANALSEFKNFLLSTSASNAQQGKALSALVREKNDRPLRVAAITAADCIYCQDLKRSFIRSVGTDLQISVSEFTVLSTQTRFDKILQGLAETAWDFILLPNYELLNARLIVALSKEGIEVGNFLGGDGWGWSTSAFNQLAKHTRFNAMALSHWFGQFEKTLSRFGESFQKSYLQHHKEVPSGVAAQGYDGAMALQAILMQPTIASGPANIRKALKSAAQRPLNFEGVLGSLKLNNASATQRPIVLIKYESDVDSGKQKQSGTIYNAN